MRPPEPCPDRLDRARRPHHRARLLTATSAVIAACVPLAMLPGASAAPASGLAGHVRYHYAEDHMGSGIAARTSPGQRAAASVRAAAQSVGGVLGMDVSGWQGNVNWAKSYAAGARFAVVKATEGLGYTNTYFAQQYDGAAGVGMIRGAYHFALPNTSSGTAQADYFVDNGGGWSSDGITLPPALDIEYNPYGPTCYRLSQASMVAWIAAFVNEVHARTGRYPLIYSTLGWWSRCTGNSAAFSADPLWIADYGSGPGTMPASWDFQTVWQYADSGPFAGDQDSFNGSPSRLAALAGTADTTTPAPTTDTVSASLPTTLVVATPTTRIPFTVTCSEPQSAVTVSLVSVATGRTSATTTVTASTPGTRFTGTVVLASRQIAGWGAQKWVVTTPDPTASATVTATMRATSVLGLKATRAGSTVTVVSGARAFDAATGRFTAWVGRKVVVQRWTTSGWITVTSARTNRLGNIRIALHIPFTVGVRLIDGPSASVWGATSPARVL
jgi:GH25 family lysozyme M1 (1,4-beta-N-acetylmuramidase)